MNINVVGARRRDVENMRRLGIMLHEILGGNSKYHIHEKVVIQDSRHTV